MFAKSCFDLGNSISSKLQMSNQWTNILQIEEKPEINLMTYSIECLIVLSQDFHHNLLDLQEQWNDFFEFFPMIFDVLLKYLFEFKQVYLSPEISNNNLDFKSPWVSSIIFRLFEHIFHIRSKHFNDFANGSANFKSFVYEILGEKVINYIFFDLAIPLMSFSVYEEELFHENFTNFLFAQKEYKNEPLLRVKAAAYDLIYCFISQNHNLFFSLIEFAEKSFSDNSNSSLQHGILFIFQNSETRNGYISNPTFLFTENNWKEIISQTGQSKTILVNQIKTRILCNVIFKGIQSSHLYIKSKTCSLLGEMEDSIWTDKDQLIHLCQLICNCLSDQNQIVKISGLKGIEYLVSIEESIPLLKDSLPIIISKILEMLKLAQLEDVIKSLHEIVKHYSNDIQIYSSEIINNLLISIHNSIDSLKEIDNVDEVEGERSDTLNSLETSLLTLNEILLLELPDEFYINSKEWVLNLFLKIMLYPQMYYLIDSMIKLFNSFLFNFKIFDQEVWQFYPLFCYMILEHNQISNNNMNIADFCQEYQIILNSGNFAKMNNNVSDQFRYLGLFGLYLQRSKGELINQHDIFGKLYIDLFFDCLDKLYQMTLQNNDDIHLNVMLKMLIFLIENCFQEISIQGEILQKVFYYISHVIMIQNKTYLVQTNFVHLLCVFLFVGGKTLLTFAIEQNNFQNLTSFLFENLKIINQNDLHEVLLIGIIGLMKLPKNSLPKNISLSFLMNQAFQSISKICELRIKLQNEDKKPVIGMAHEIDQYYDSEDDVDDDDEDYNWNQDDYIGEDIQFEYESPFLFIDEVIEFENLLKEIQANDPNDFNFIINQISVNEQNSLFQMFEFAKTNKKI